MTSTTLAEPLAEAFEKGRGEVAGTELFLPIVTLESGARCGLDREGHWLLVPGDGRAPVRFDEVSAPAFQEAIEKPRARFDEAVETAARALGLPAEEVLWSFPAVELVRAVLAKEHAYLTRLALEWIGPTELRPLRPAIVAVTKVATLPVSVRDLAKRLIVNE
jgi:hypothetical protein